MLAVEVGFTYASEEDWQTNGILNSRIFFFFKKVHKGISGIWGQSEHVQFFCERKKEEGKKEVGKEGRCYETCGYLITQEG